MPGTVPSLTWALSVPVQSRCQPYMVSMSQGPRLPALSQPTAHRLQLLLLWCQAPAWHLPGPALSLMGAPASSSLQPSPRRASSTWLFPVATVPCSSSSPPGTAESLVWALLLHSCTGAVQLLSTHGSSASCSQPSSRRSPSSLRSTKILAGSPAWALPNCFRSEGSRASELASAPA